MSEKNFTDKKFWQEYYKDFKPQIIGKIYFHDIFNTYLTADPSKSVLEIGCAGGNYLCYLAKNFNFQPYGIDYSDEIVKTYATFEANGLMPPTLYQEDFFLWKTEKKFDIICSFGFIEHFSDLDEVIKKHVDLLAPGGTLIITIPHFAHCQYIFHWLIDRENLKKHNTKIMNLHSLRSALLDQPLDILHLSYYRTFGFWTERKNLRWWEKIIQYKINLLGRVMVKIFGWNRPNFLFSPHIVCVAKKI